MERGKRIMRWKNKSNIVVEFFLVKHKSWKDDKIWHLVKLKMVLCVAEKQVLCTFQQMSTQYLTWIVKNGYHELCLWQIVKSKKITDLLSSPVKSSAEKGLGDGDPVKVRKYYILNL